MNGVASRGGRWHGLVDRPRMLILIVLLVAVAGVSSLMVLPRMEDPVMVQRAGIVTTRLPGADAGRVEALVTEKIEDELRQVEEIKEIRSQSRPGVSTISIELLDSIDQTDEVWAKVRGKIDDALPELPSQATRPEFDEIEIRGFARIVSVVWLAGDEPDYGVLRRTAKRLQDRLESVPGTESVSRFGDPGEEVLVRVDPMRVAAIGLTTGDVARQLASLDVKQAAGTIRGSDTDLAVELGNQFRRLDDVAAADIVGADGRFVGLDRVAEVTLATPEPLPRKARHEDLPAISLGALIRIDVRIDRWSAEAARVIDAFEAELPGGLAIRHVMDQNAYVSDRLAGLTGNLAAGATAVCVVVLLMMGWRSALVVAAALPLTVLTVLFAMRVLGTPIHQMSVTGLIIALGLLIDNAIVVTDEIRGELVAGKRPGPAVGHVTRRLAIPLLGSTLTTAFAFAPIALMPGPAGEFVGSIANGVILAIAASLVFSLTVISTLAALFIRVDRHGLFRQGVSSARLERVYRGALTTLYRHPGAAIGLAIVPPLVGFAFAPTLPEQFFPPADRDQFHIEVELAPGSSLASTSAVARKIDAIADDEGIAQVDWYFGESAPTFYYNQVANRRGEPNYAQAIVRSGDATGLRETIRRLQNRIDVEVSGARVLVRQLEQGPPFDAPVEVRLFGPDLEVLRSLGDQVRGNLAEVADVTHTRGPLGETLPKQAIDVDVQSASLAGLTPAEIADQVQMSLDGRIGGSLLQETEELPVRVRVDDVSRSRVTGLREIELIAPSMPGNVRDSVVPGDPELVNTVPLRAVARFRLNPEVGVIVRLNRQRMNEIGAFVTAGTLPSIVLERFEKRLAASDFELPAGYRMTYGGEASKRDDAVGNLMASVGVLLAMMVGTLVLSLGSFRLAGMIGAVAFFSVGLGLLAILVGGYPFGFMAIIGTMGLIGVAINDSIVVISSIRDRHADAARTGQPEWNPETLAETVSRCTRHIVATTLTTAAGFTPLILGGGDFWPPLAVAIAGGVLGATLLALVFAPACYQLLIRRPVGRASTPA